MAIGTPFNPVSSWILEKENACVPQRQRA